MNPQKYPAGVLRGKESKRPSSSLSFANKFTRSSRPHGKDKAQTERLHVSRLLLRGRFAVQNGCQQRLVGAGQTKK